MKPLRVWRRAIKRLSRVWLPSSRKTVAHSHINNYDLLVLANEEVGRAIHFGKNYEQAETAYMQKVIDPTSVCVDVGANVGYFAMLMAKNAYKGRVFAFEPIPLNAALLRASVELNGFSNVEIIECAIGDSDTEVTLSQSTDGAYSSLHDTARKSVERLIRVPMITLDSFVQSRSIPSIHVLKIDVEGAEALVIEGARTLLEDTAKRPSFILMELADMNLKYFNTNASAIVEKMHELGYIPYFVDNNTTLMPFRADALDTFYNVLFLASGLSTVRG